MQSNPRHCLSDILRLFISLAANISLSAKVSLVTEEAFQLEKVDLSWNNCIFDLWCSVVVSLSLGAL